MRRKYNNFSEWWLGAPDSLSPSALVVLGVFASFLGVHSLLTGEFHMHSCGVNLTGHPAMIAASIETIAAVAIAGIALRLIWRGWHEMTDDAEESGEQGARTLR